MPAFHILHICICMYSPCAWVCMHACILYVYVYWPNKRSEVHNVAINIYNRSAGKFC